MNHRFSRLLHVYGVTIDFISLNTVYLVSRSLLQENVPWPSREDTTFWIGLNAGWLVASWMNRLYTEKTMTSSEQFSRRTMHAFFYWLVVVLTWTFFFGHTDLPRLFLAVVLFSHGAMLLLNRLLFFVTRKYLREKALLTRKVLILGYNETAKKLASYLEEEDSLTQIVGYCENEQNVRELSTYPVLAGLNGALDVSVQYGVSEIYTTIAPEHNQAIYGLMKKAEQACIRFRFIPDFSFFINQPCHVEYIRDMPVLAIRKEPLDDEINRLKKRVLDVLVSLLVIVFVLSWLIPLLSLLIWAESPGPVFFKQLRSGRNNKPFWCLKFRSMRVNGEANARQASRNDSRITKTGGILRKTSLDEFPQFFNVLLGEMSLVGPRPHMLKHTDDYSHQLDDFMVRHFVKPGITGWAQVNGYRGETKALSDMQGRIERDLWYLENWSLWLDVKILFLTAYNMVRGEKNAF